MTAAWFVSVLLLLGADVLRVRRRLAPYLAALVVQALFTLDFTGLDADEGLLLAWVERATRVALIPILAWTARRVLRDARAPRFALWIGLAQLPTAAISDYGLFMSLHMAGWIVVALLVLVGLFESASRGERPPSATDVALAMLVISDLVSYSVILVDHTTSWTMTAAVWSQTVVVSIVSFSVAAFAHTIEWRGVVERVGR